MGKEIRFVVIRSGEVREGGNWMKAVKRYKLPVINNYQAYNVQHDKYN